MFNGSSSLPPKDYPSDFGLNNDIQSVMANSDSLIGIDEVQKSLNRSRASVYRYTNTDTRNVNPAFNPRKLNPEYRTDQKDPLLFHPNEVARFAKDILRIKEVNVEVLNSPSTVTQSVLNSILEELRAIRLHLESTSESSKNISNSHKVDDRSAA
tara:strand:- start:462 stop:926 length:465 start_codon:yes stop_codon:yes gene_type:complete